MYIGIIGSRRRNGKSDFKAVLKKFQELYHDGDSIVSGGCKQGGDRFAKEIALQREISYIEFPAQWEKLGRSAGFQRNGKIAEKSDCLIACVAEDRTGGTEDTIKKYTRLGKTDLHLV